MLNYGISRPLVSQPFLSFPLAVPGACAAIAISSTIDKAKLITGFVISNPAAGSSVYLGNSGVAATGANQGLEIQPGTSPFFAVRQEDRQLYELQALLQQIAMAMKCQNVEMEKIPFIVWDLTQLYLFSANAAGSNVTIGVFPQPYL